MSKTGLLFVLLLLFSNAVKSQQICSTIDSIKVYSLPFYMETNLSLSSYEVKSESYKGFLSEVTFKNDSIVTTFANEVIGTITKDSLSNFTNIDVRVVLEIFTDKNVKIVVAVDRKGYYECGSNFAYKRNYNLIQWLRKYVKYCEHI